MSDEEYGRLGSDDGDVYSDSDNGHVRSDSDNGHTHSDSDNRHTHSDSDDVQIHLNFTMWGAVPLRLVDLLFRSDHLLLVEYGYLTPLNLATGSPSRRAAAFADHIASEGLAAALAAAESVIELAYDTLDTVRVYDGGRFGREAVAVEPSTGPTQVVRVHGPVDVDRFVDAVGSVLSDHAVTVERHEGIALEFNGLLGRLSRR